MKTKLYTLFLLLFYSLYAKAQTCAGVQLGYTATESRCVATGSLQVSVTGGSGSFNYQVTGPVSTPLTSSPLITGLAPGYYRIIVKDLVNNCTSELDSAYVSGTYADPRFQLVKTNVSCLGNDGRINVQNVEFGRPPFSYTIVAPSPSSVGTTSATGQFTGLVPGEYAIEQRDSCGGIQVRRVTIENYIWWIDSTSINRIGCDSAGVFIRVRDNRGNDNTLNGGFTGFSYGIVRAPGDTLYRIANNFRFYMGTQRSLTIVVKDNCGNIKTVPWTLPASARPLLGPEVISNITCSTFTVSFPVQQNLTNPSFCLYGDNLIGCNSTGTFANLPFGAYCIEMVDLCYDTAIVVCFNMVKPEPAVDNAVAISNQNCNTFTATVTGQTNLINPNYCLLRSNGDTVACNATGVFNNIPYGNYCIRVRNGCNDTTIVRCFRANKPIPLLTSYNISGRNCTGFNVSLGGSNLNTPRYCIYDSTGQLITCDSTGNFNGLPYGSYCVRAISCGDTTAPLCFSAGRLLPSVGANVQISNKVCSGFTATINGQSNLTAPQYCLYNNNDSLLQCNTTGVFNNLAYGSYCIKVKDSCTDSTIVRCFSASRNQPSINATVNQSNAGCAGFRATVTGTNLTNPEYCLMDTLGNVVSCNTTGVFNNVPWGRWCFRVRDNCVDTTMTVCQTFTRPRGITVTSTKSCVIGSANISLLFAGGFWPFTIQVYHPNGTKLMDTVTNANPFSFVLPGLPAGAQYKIVGTDNCGFKDSALLTPDASAVVRSITVNGKCPSATWQNGAGDLRVSCTSNLYTTMPVIIRKNGTLFNQSFSSVAGSVYTFTDLEPATYVVQYNMQTCNSSVTDTVVVPPYTFPRQGQSAIYQCDNNTLSLGANVQGGIGPYTYQIIGSTPSAPSITTGVQTSPLFSINTNTVYSLVRLRAVDACGNATLDDVSVLPLQNFSVTASQLCFFNEVVLRVDSIANATYTWYRKTTPTDSVLLGSGAIYNLPFFRPDQVGQYVCHIDVHGGCTRRRAAFTLDGDCGNITLPGAIALSGRKLDDRYQLNWRVANEQENKAYIVERRKVGEAAFQAMATIMPAAANNGWYKFTDDAVSADYRIRINTVSGATLYSNVVTAKWTIRAQVFPNPVREKLTVRFNDVTNADFRLQVFDVSGRLVHQQLLRKPGQHTVVVPVNKNWRPGMYQLRLINQQTNDTDTHTLVIQ